jgi:hypothetical protein
VVTRVADAAGVVSFGGSSYRAGRAWARQRVQVAIVAGSVPLSAAGKVIRVRPIRHDRGKEHGAFAVPDGRPRKPAGGAAAPARGQEAPDGAGVKATAATRSA